MDENKLIYLIYLLNDFLETTILDLKTQLITEGKFQLNKQFEQKITKSIKSNRTLLKDLQSLGIDTQFEHGDFADKIYDLIKEELNTLLKSD